MCGARCDGILKAPLPTDGQGHCKDYSKTCETTGADGPYRSKSRRGFMTDGEAESEHMFVD